MAFWSFLQKKKKNSLKNLDNSVFRCTFAPQFEKIAQKSFLSSVG